MEQKYGRANRVWVMDRGMVSEENLKFLRSRQGQYLVGTPKAMLRQFEEELAKIKSGDVLLPTVTRQGQPAKTIRLRCVTQPDPAQKVPLNRLGIQLPRRLRRFDEVVQM